MREGTRESRLLRSEGPHRRVGSYTPQLASCRRHVNRNRPHKPHKLTAVYETSDGVRLFPTAPARGLSASRAPARGCARSRPVPGAAPSPLAFSAFPGSRHAAPVALGTPGALFSLASKCRPVAQRTTGPRKAASHPYRLPPGGSGAPPNRTRPRSFQPDTFPTAGGSKSQPARIFLPPANGCRPGTGCGACATGPKIRPNARTAASSQPDPSPLPAHASPPGA